jgi:hypothetical protein
MSSGWTYKYSGNTHPSNVFSIGAICSIRRNAQVINNHGNNDSWKKNKLVIVVDQLMLGRIRVEMINGLGKYNVAVQDLTEVTDPVILVRLKKEGKV